MMLRSLNIWWESVGKNGGLKEDAILLKKVPFSFFKWRREGGGKAKGKCQRKVGTLNYNICIGEAVLKVSYRGRNKGI